MLIRKETPADHPAVFQLIEEAFRNEELSDHLEQYLVERLRKSEAFVPELSIVAEQNQQIIGYILLTKIVIRTNNAEDIISLALAPVAVLNQHQGKGIGAQLIREAHSVAKNLGYKSVILLGHAYYYPRFGYKKASLNGIQLPFDVPEENCMAIELQDGALKGITGTVVYPQAFFE